MFFALWPDAGVQGALGTWAQDLKRECGGRALPVHNIHLTLVFLGNVERSSLARLGALAAAIEASRFELSVDRVEYWRHNRILWAGVERCPEALLALVARLELGLSSDGFRFDKRPYVPHITLLRNAARAPAAAGTPRVAWPVAKFALMESIERGRGRIYEVRNEWRLSA